MPPPDFSTWIQSAREHLPATLLIAGLVYAVLVLAALSKPHPGRRIVGVLFTGYLFFTIGLLFLAKAVAAGAFGPDAAAWLMVPADSTSPEAAYGCLAFAAIGFLALARNIGLRAAAVLGPAIYLGAPLLATTPTKEGLIAHAAEVTIIALGAVLLLLQAAVERPARPMVHATPLMAPEPTPEGGRG